MTDIEAKALALVNDAAQDRHYPIWPSFERTNGNVHEALCRAIEREAAAEARHAAELRELNERFSEAAWRVYKVLKHSPDAGVNWMADGILSPFILPAPDPLVEAWQMAFPGNHIEDARDECAKISAAIEKRGGKIVWEAGE